LGRNCCYFGNISSCSLGDYQRYPGSSCGSSYPSNLVYSTSLCNPSSCHQGSSLYSGCQENCCEPTRCQTSLVVFSPCQTSCYHCPRSSMLCSPFWITYPGSLSFSSNSFSSLSSGSRSCYSLGCESSGYRPQGYGICVFPSLRHGSRFCRPTYFASRSCQSSCYRPTCGSGFYLSTC
uniref:Keratin-associated protein n=1 Tax=Catagonus wagneri TaxID=51154 RepID=A0A8C3X3X5_9CETA